jgi:hypothetical protein
MFIFDRFKEIINDFNKLDSVKKTTTVLTKENIKTRKRRKIGKR